LLTCSGEILEIYTYYQLLKTGYFDDVACGYEFRWQDGGVTNELDIIAVKGFRSVIVECKAVQKLELNYYHKLHSIAEHFGIVFHHHRALSDAYCTAEAFIELMKIKNR
jgi:hypothetical protein